MKTQSQFQKLSDGRIGIRFPVIPETAPTPVTAFRHYAIEGGEVVVKFSGRRFLVYEEIVRRDNQLEISYLKAIQI